MAKVKQKVSGCFRLEVYDHAYCRIPSYLQTRKAKGLILFLLPKWRWLKNLFSCGGVGRYRLEYNAGVIDACPNLSGCL